MLRISCGNIFKLISAKEFNKNEMLSTEFKWGATIKGHSREVMFTDSMIIFMLNNYKLIINSPAMK